MVRTIPSRSAHAANQKIGLPDRLELSGDKIQVIAGGTPTDRFRLEKITRQERNPSVLRAERGVPSKGKWQARWIVSGSGPFEIHYRAEKARDLSTKGTLK